MRCFQPPADVRFYAGVDLHARSLFLCVLDRDGQEPLRPQPARRPRSPSSKPCSPSATASSSAASACTAGTGSPTPAATHDIPFALGHAWAMKAVHGSKTKCDRHDAEAIARLLRGGNFPLAYAYPKERRGLRDLLRARLRLVRQRAELYGHVHTARRQANLPPVSSDVKYKSKRGGVTADIADPFVRRRVETHLALLEPLDTTIRRLEAEIEEAAKEHYPTELAVLQSTPGVGAVLSLTILLEIDADRPLRHAPAVLLLRPAVRRRAGVGRQARRRGQPQGGQRLAEVGLQRGGRARAPRRTNASAACWSGWRRGWASPRRCRRWPTSWAGPSTTCCIRRRSLTSTAS